MLLPPASHYLQELPPSGIGITSLNSMCPDRSMLLDNMKLIKINGNVQDG